MEIYEEYHEWSRTRSWLFIFFLSGALITVCMLLMFTVKDVPRVWSHGNLGFTPSESIYSTVEPGSPNQLMVEPLPDSGK